MLKSEVLKGKRIVIAEDEGVIQIQLRKGLGLAGLIVVGQAMTGEAALEIVLEEKPDLVLMDLSLPGMDGIEITRRVLAENSRLLVVMMPGNSDALHRQQALDAGACGYLLKPITMSELIAELEHCWKQHDPKQNSAPS